MQAFISKSADKSIPQESAESGESSEPDLSLDLPDSPDSLDSLDSLMYCSVNSAAGEETLTLTLYFLRHGQTPMSREDVFCGSGLDPELTAEGLEMAQSFANAYRTASWSAVYSSPLRRTVETARPLCEALGLQLELRDDLKEIGYGKWEGQTKEAVDLAHHDDYLQWLADPAWYPPTGGEMAVAIARRALRAVEEIRGRFTTGNVLVVSHKATIRILLCGLLGI